MWIFLEKNPTKTAKSIIMQFTNVDMLVRRTLLERGLPIHWYPEILFHTSSAIRELSKDTLKIINTVKLAVNSYSAADLPGDFVDDVAVAIPVGNLLQKVSKNDNITPLRLHDATTGAFVPYSEQGTIGQQTIFWGGPNWFWFWNISDWGEPTGRYFGATGGAKQNGYTIVKERRQIQLTESFTNDEIVLKYISNGQSSDNATQVDWLAFAAIQAYVDWKRSPNAAIELSGEARSFYNQKRLLRANLNPLTVTDIVNVLRESFTASIKN